MIALIVAVTTWTLSTVTLSIIAIAAIEHARRTRTGRWEDYV